MNRRIFVNFIKDKTIFTFGFLINSLILIVFFSLSTGSSVEVLYPLLISCFIYFILIIIEWSKYYKFNINLHKSIENVSFDLQPITSEQQETANTINSIHDKYVSEIAEISMENQNNRHFISQWIHNMKTPVSVIDLIIQKSNSEQLLSMEAITDINEENQRLHTILDQVLNVLRLENFSKDYIPETTDLVSSVKKVINSKKNQFIYNKVFPKLHCSSEAIVLSDSKWNELMIEQIVSNAIKYSNPGDDSKNISFEIEQKSEMTYLKIRDEGIGIPSYDIKKVYEPFFTGENGRKYKNATGIGLYICSIIAQKLGHDLQIESELGKGTSVTISYLSKL